MDIIRKNLILYFCLLFLLIVSYGPNVSILSYATEVIKHPNIPSTSVVFEDTKIGMTKNQIMASQHGTLIESKQYMLKYLISEKNKKVTYFFDDTYTYTNQIYHTVILNDPSSEFEHYRKEFSILYGEPYKTNISEVVWYYDNVVINLSSYYNNSCDGNSNCLRIYFEEDKIDKFDLKAIQRNKASADYKVEVDKGYTSAHPYIHYKSFEQLRRTRQQNLETELKEITEDSFNDIPKGGKLIVFTSALSIEAGNSKWLKFIAKENGKIILKSKGVDRTPNGQVQGGVGLVPPYTVWSNVSIIDIEKPFANIEFYIIDTFGTNSTRYRFCIKKKISESMNTGEFRGHNT